MTGNTVMLLSTAWTAHRQCHQISRPIRLPDCSQPTSRRDLTARARIHRPPKARRQPKPNLSTSPARLVSGALPRKESARMPALRLHLRPRGVGGTSGARRRRTPANTMALPVHLALHLLRTRLGHHPAQSELLAYTSAAKAWLSLLLPPYFVRIHSHHLWLLGNAFASASASEAWHRSFVYFDIHRHGHKHAAYHQPTELYHDSGSLSMVQQHLQCTLKRISCLPTPGRHAYGYGSRILRRS